MIHYSLVCAEGHGFDGWFKNSAAYETQAARGLIVCPFCRSAKVSKAVMAPNVARGPRAGPEGRNRQNAIEEEAPTPPPVRDATSLDERDAALAVMRELREKIIALTEDVGKKFPEEARRIQDGDAERRAIRGQASFEEAKALLEDGVEILPLPEVPGEGH